MKFKTLTIWCMILSACSLAMIVAASCKPGQHQENLQDQYAEIIRNNLNDNAFKNTSELKIYSLFVLRIDTVTMNTIDSELIKKTSERIEFCNAMADLHLSMSKSTARLDALYRKMKKKTFAPGSSEDQEDNVKAKIYQDSVKYYLHLDTLINERISNNKHPDSIYRVKTFIKATLKKDGDSTNYLDTFYYFIGKDRKIIEIPSLN